MGTGRRFVSFWLLLLTACISGCCGCGACGDCSDGCNLGDLHLDFCGDGGCDWFGDGGGGLEPDAAHGPQAIRSGLSAPTALFADGSELVYVDRGELFVVGTDGSSPLLLASGVGNVGNVISDGIDVYWAGTWSDELADGGVDASDAASIDDAGDAADDGGVDAGDAGAPVFSGTQGIFRASITGDYVARVATFDPLPTLDLAGASLVVRARTDDAGTSSLGGLDPNDGGFVPIASLAGNTENLHAFAVGSNGIYALDADGIVLVADGGKELVATGAGDSSLLGTSTGVALVTTGDDASFRIVRLPDGLFASGDGTATALASRGDRVFVADGVAAAIHVYTVSQLQDGSASMVPTPGAPPSLVTADDAFVYWSSGGSLFRAPLP